MTGLVTAVLALGVAPPPFSPRPEPLPGLVARSIGPATMGGRIPALAVVESQPSTQYIGTAAGGLWKTTDDGKTWACVFAGRPHPSIGAVAVARSDPRVVWIGTGEANPRNSASWGNGVFVSRDAGKVWRHVGLEDTHHIGRIVVHPTNPEVAYVAALGHIWGPNRQRGVFATRDGGQSWDHLLRLDSDTGCIDLVMDPSDPLTLYAAAYRVRRGDFSGGNPAEQFGPLAGIYRTRDGGKTWKRLTQGLPTNPLGRIGLSIWRRDPRVLYAVLQTDRTDIRTVPGQAPGYGPIEIGGIFFSRDRGETWVKINNLCPRPFYFSKTRIEPTDTPRLWVLGLPLYVSADGGRTFHPDGAKAVHVDHHDLWINPADPRHMVLGGDGGLHHTHDGGLNWAHIDNLPISQFYGVAVDSHSPYRIYGGLQDNGSWGGPSRTRDPNGILNDDWKRILGMDGFQCQVPADDPDTIYAEGQYGRLHRIEMPLRKAISIRPYSSGPKKTLYRFHWSSPLALSVHDTKTIYYGGSQLFKSTDRGTTWRVLSPDLTRGEAGIAYSHMGHTLTAFAESPVRRGLFYVGSDDGKVHVTRDEGGTWVDVSDRLPGVPQNRCITRIACSPFAAGTAWVALTRHRQDDRRPYLFRTDNFGQSWHVTTGNMPLEGPIHMVRADDRNRDLLYVGTEFGLFLSLNGGITWQQVQGGLPPCPVHDVVVHPRAREMVVATHGRGLYVMDVSALQDLTADVRSKRMHLFPPSSASHHPPTKTPPVTFRTYQGQNPPDGAVIWYRLKQTEKAVRVDVVAPGGRIVYSQMTPAHAGLHCVRWDLKGREGQEVSPGEYRVRLRLKDDVQEEKLRVFASENR